MRQMCGVSSAETRRLQVYSSLGAGAWTFQVRSTDVAGNTEAAPYQAFSWSVSLPANFPIISGGTTGVTGR